MFSEITFILSLVCYLQCIQNETEKDLETDQGVYTSSYKSTPRPGIHIDSHTYIIIVIVFIVLVCSLSIVALLLGVKTGKKRALHKKYANELDSKHKWSEYEDLRMDSKEIEEPIKTIVTPLHKTESIDTALEVSHSTETTRSLSSEHSNKSKGKKESRAPDSQVLAYSTKGADNNSEEESQTSSKLPEDLKNDPK